MDDGRAPSGQATRASPEPASSLGHSASVLRALIERCEKQDAAEWAEVAELFEDVFREIHPKPERIWVTDNTGDWTDDYSNWQARQCDFYGLLEPQAFFEAALALLPEGADWRRLTDVSASVYAANPYNAKAQKRHDGYGPTVALQICSAALKVRLEPILKALAIEARSAATGNTDAARKGESAGLKGNAQKEQP